MAIVQLNIFDCDTDIRKNDCVFQRLMELQNEEELNVGNMQIKRNKRFYVVEKSSDFEVVFLNIQSCYEFVNRNL